MNDDLLEQLQADVTGILRATPGLTLANIIQDNKGDLEGNLETELATAHSDSGKAGLAIIVLAVEVTGAEENLPGPPLEALVNIQCIELVEMNRSVTDGTGIRSSTAATRVLGALHHTSLDTHVLYAAKHPIRPLPMRDGFVAHMVSIRTTLNGLPTLKTGPVTPSWDDEAGTLSLACATPHAVIHYTVDGSFPGPGASGSTLYAGPVPLVPGNRLRAAAYAPDLNPGDVLDLTITE